MSRINLKKHGVIEAHAGTGKTWTIVNDIVLPALMGEGAGRILLSELCVVTYTEKAAEELKLRIRECIVERKNRLAKERTDPSGVAHADACLVSMNEAFIGTIHSFCLRILKEYPFETGVPFAFEMTDDNEGLRMILRRIVRDSWPEMGIDLTYLAPGNISSLMESIVEIAGACSNPDIILDPENEVDRPAVMQAMSACKNADRLSREVVENVKENIAVLAVCREHAGVLTEDNERYLDDIIRGWKSVVDKNKVEKASDIMGKGKSPDAMFNKLTKGKSSAGQHPLVANASEAYRRIASLPAFVEWKSTVDRGEDLKSGIIAETVPLLSSLWKNHKREHKLMSFDDLLITVKQAVADNETLRILLRERIKYAVIDEFQDTSALQWDIFRILFLKKGEDTQSRLYIVGDPKQSIYRFQNASVECYLSACSSVADHRESQPLIRLTTNYRSEKALIAAYNRIFMDGSGSYFSHEHIIYNQENSVDACKREPVGETQGGLRVKPLYIVPVSGTPAFRLVGYAKKIIECITSSITKEVNIPFGTGYKTIVLEYHHFAVIAESHHLADAMLSYLVDAGIPAEKYKLEGIFTAHMATEWRTLLDALSMQGNVFQKRVKALFTSFFDAAPASVDPEAVLQDNAHAGKLFSRWEDLSKKKMWARLFADIHKSTLVNERLIQLVDGERRICDLRHITDYSITYLMSNGGTVENLVEHLSHCAHGYAFTSREASLHARENARSKVQVMTIHASKGLEFPFCFIVTGSSSSRLRSYMRWAEVKHEDGIDAVRLHVTPVSSSSVITESDWYKDATSNTEKQDMQERRRLLYVALTRAQKTIYLPMHLACADDKGEYYSSRKLPSRGADHDLVPILARLADKAIQDDADGILNPVGIISGEADVDITENDLPLLPQVEYPVKPLSSDAEAAAAENAIIDAVHLLRLEQRKRFRMSYSSLVHPAVERISIAESQHEPILSENEMHQNTGASSKFVLPPGKQTGNALHEIIDGMITSGLPGKPEDFGVDDPALHARAKVILGKNGLSGGGADLEKRREEELVALAKQAVSHTYAIPGDCSFRITDIDAGDLFTEAEFNSVAGVDQMIGFIDLLFRIPLNGGGFRYFIIDWKSTLLDEYTESTIADDVVINGYDRQAFLYCHVLDRWLRSINPDEYNPARNLGGALVVYVRGLMGPKEQPVWWHKADPDADAAFTNATIATFINSRRNSPC